MSQTALLLIALSFCSLAYGRSWTEIPRGLVQVSGNLNYIWGIDQTMDIFLCARPCTGTWKKIDGKLVQLDVDDHQVWGVNKDHNIFVRPVDGTGSWKHINGKLIDVSASGSGYVWGVNSAHAIYKCKKPCTGSWQRVGGSLVQIDGGEREACGVNRHQNMYCIAVDGSGAWRNVPGKFKHVTASGPDDIFAISANNELQRCKKPCVGDWIKVDHSLISSLKQCDATANALFGVFGQTVWRKDFPL